MPCSSNRTRSQSSSPRSSRKLAGDGHTSSGSEDRSSTRAARARATASARSRRSSSAPASSVVARTRQRAHRPRLAEPAKPAGQLRPGEQVAHPHPGQPPQLGEAAHAHEPRDPGGVRARGVGQEVGKRLVHDQDPARPGQGGQHLLRLVTSGRVVRAAEHDQVRLLGHRGRVEDEAFGGVAEDPVHRDPTGAQGRLGGGERRVHAGRQPWPQRLGEQPERLRRAVEQQALIGCHAVPSGDRLQRRSLVGVRREVDRLQVTDQPVGRRPPDVDGEVHGSGRDLTVAMVGKGVFESVHH